MPRRNVFHFKQFSIEQERCAMKVCTDACAFGAWTQAGTAKTALDIGTGTGLLALMLAQKSPDLRIDAVELDMLAAQQAQENIENSPFSKQIRVFNQAIQDFDLDLKYDLIISNPPFFQTSLLSPDQKINQAHHAESLNLNDLLHVVLKFLGSKGCFMLMLPPFEFQKFQELAQKKGVFLQKQLALKHQADKAVFRLIGEFAFQETPIQHETLIISENDNRTYTKPYQTLLQQYYLIF